MVHSTKVEIIWTIIPVIILVVMAIPAAEIILKMEDTRDSELSIRVTGYQWKWQYQYMDAAEGINFFSTLSQDSNFARQLHSGIDPSDGAELSAGRRQADGGAERHQGAAAADLPGRDPRVVGARFRREALGDPRLRQRTVVQGHAGKEGIYRGQCAALCGRDHGFMPVVVDVRTPDDFKKWVEEQKAAAQTGGGVPAGSAALRATVLN